MSGINNNFARQRPPLPPSQPPSFWWREEGPGTQGAFGLYFGSFLLPILDEVMTRDNPAFPLEYARDVGDDSRLALNEQNNVLKKLRRKIYNPAPKRLTKRVSQYYKGVASKSSLNNKVKQRDDTDEMRCAICLDDFEAKQVVLVTPCDHMFHEDCIVPWVKSRGQCPVCRSGVSDQM